MDNQRNRNEDLLTMNFGFLGLDPMRYVNAII